MKFRRQYADPIGDEALGVSSGLVFDPLDDRTEQHHAPETEIPAMLARMGVNPDRDLPVVTISDVVKDVTLLPDTLQEAFDVIEAGREAFFQLPAGVRAAFDNDPRRFVTATEEQLIAAGIPAAEKEPAVPATEVSEGGQPEA